MYLFQSRITELESRKKVSIKFGNVSTRQTYPAEKIKRNWTWAFHCKRNHSGSQTKYQRCEHGRCRDRIYVFITKKDALIKHPFYCVLIHIIFCHPCISTVDHRFIAKPQHISYRCNNSRISHSIRILYNQPIHLSFF